jgi:protein-disulfide isomerase
MIKNIIGLAGLTVGALLVSACASTAQDALFTAQHEERVEEIVRAYLLQNPEIITEAIHALRERQTAEEAARVAQALQEHRDELLADPMSPVGGNPEGTVTMVEFFDYNCAYCRRAGPVVAEMLERNPDVRLVYKEFPTLAPSSRFAARPSPPAVRARSSIRRSTMR